MPNLQTILFQKNNQPHTTWRAAGNIISQELLLIAIIT